MSPKVAKSVSKAEHGSGKKTKDKEVTVADVTAKKNSIIPCRISVYWNGDLSYFRGTVTSIRPAGEKRFHVKYDDGDADDEDLATDRFRWHGPRAKSGAVQYKDSMRVGMMSLNPENLQSSESKPEDSAPNGVIPVPSGGAPKNEAAIGWRIKLWWPGTREWVEGEVLNHRRQDNRQHVLFCDGEDEWLRLLGETVWWVGNSKDRSSRLQPIAFGLEGRCAPKGRDAVKWRVGLYSVGSGKFLRAEIAEYNSSTGKHRVQYLEDAEGEPSEVSLTASKVAWKSPPESHDAGEVENEEKVGVADGSCGKEKPTVCGKEKPTVCGKEKPTVCGKGKQTVCGKDKQASSSKNKPDGPVAKGVKKSVDASTSKRASRKQRSSAGNTRSVTPVKSPRDSTVCPGGPAAANAAVSKGHAATSALPAAGQRLRPQASVAPTPVVRPVKPGKAGSTRSSAAGALPAANHVDGIAREGVQVNASLVKSEPEPPHSRALSTGASPRRMPHATPPPLPPVPSPPPSTKEPKPAIRKATVNSKAASNRRGPARPAVCARPTHATSLADEGDGPSTPPQATQAQPQHQASWSPFQHTFYANARVKTSPDLQQPPDVFSSDPSHLLVAVRRRISFIENLTCFINAPSSQNARQRVRLQPPPPEPTVALIPAIQAPPAQRIPKPLMLCLHDSPSRPDPDRGAVHARVTCYEAPSQAVPVELARVQVDPAHCVPPTSPPAATATLQLPMSPRSVSLAASGQRHTGETQLVRQQLVASAPPSTSIPIANVPANSSAVAALECHHSALPSTPQAVHTLIGPAVLLRSPESTQSLPSQAIHLAPHTAPTLLTTPKATPTFGLQACTAAEGTCPPASTASLATKNFGAMPSAMPLNSDKGAEKHLKRRASCSPPFQGVCRDRESHSGGSKHRRVTPSKCAVDVLPRVIPQKQLASPRRAVPTMAKSTHLSTCGQQARSAEQGKGARPSSAGVLACSNLSDCNTKDGSAVQGARPAVLQGIAHTSAGPDQWATTGFGQVMGLKGGSPAGASGGRAFG